MATYNHINNTFTLTLNELNFTIPRILPGSAPLNEPMTPDSKVIGNALGNVLIGDATNNSINGAEGNDTIIGGAGADILDGGDGIDTLSYATASAGVDVTLNGVAAGSTGGTSGVGDHQGDTILGFENLTGSNHADTLNGNTGANFIDGGMGDDILTGKAGNDTLFGGLGADTMQGEADNDLYYVDNSLDKVSERSGAGYDHVITTVTFDLAARGDGEVEVFQAAAGAGAISLYGNYHTNWIIGNEAGNVIDGRGGADTMQGGAGDDTYTVENSGDVVIEDSAFGGTDLVNTSISYTLGDNVENLTGTGTAAITLTGNALNNVIIGNSGNNVIFGGGGADVMMGGGGNDTYYVDDLGDQIIDNSGIDTVIVTNPKVLTALATTIENIKAAPGKTNMDIKGNAKANTLHGNDGANKITGLGSKDKLWGHKGKDTFIFKEKAGKTHMDTIYDYKPSDDTIWIDNKYMSKLGKGSEKKPGKLNKAFFTVGESAKDDNDFLIYNKKTGILYYDKDGVGGAKQLEIAKFTNKPTLTAGEFFII